MDKNGFREMASFWGYAFGGAFAFLGVNNILISPGTSVTVTTKIVNGKEVRIEHPPTGEFSLLDLISGVALLCIGAAVIYYSWKSKPGR